VKVTPARGKTRRNSIIKALGGGLLALLVLSIAYALSVAWVPMGKQATGARLKRVEASEHWDKDEDRFVDVMPRKEPSILRILPKWLEKPVPHRRPTQLPRLSPTKASFAQAPVSQLRVTWLGHSTLIVEIENRRILIDPVWGDYVAPLDIKTTRRFGPPPLPFDQLPHLDAVLISHDHYDHLDYPTVLRLNELELPFYVPLGVGSHLSYWGVPESRIFEHEWWDESMLLDLKLVCTPARHFSGRSLVDRDHTLWSGWALIGRNKRVYYSGDTALFAGFADIGRRFGPFDLTMIESGAYNQMWADVHLGPEQAVVAHQLLKGRVLLPVHWGMFDLGLHGWTEPIERIRLAAQKAHVTIVSLPPGGSFEPDAPPPLEP